MSDSSWNTMKLWLRSMLQTDDLPPFEENDETLSILQQLMKQHQENERFSELHGNQIEQEILEYIAEAKHMKCILSALSMDPSQDCSPRLSQYIKTLSQTAVELGVSYPSLPCMAVAMCDFVDQQDKLQTNLRHNEEMFQQMVSEVSDIQELRNQLESELGELESSLAAEHKNAESLQRSMHFLSHKKKDYQKQIAEQEKVLNQSGYSSDISHSELVKLGQEAHKLEDSIKPFRLQLDTYKVLPANLDQAKLKLHEKMAEVKAIEGELHDTLQNLTLTS